MILKELNLVNVIFNREKYRITEIMLDLFLEFEKNGFLFLFIWV